MKKWVKLFAGILLPAIFIIPSCCNNHPPKPNILFVMMDDLGYGQFGIYNDTITTDDFNPYFKHLVDSLQGYSFDKALEFSKSAIPALTKLAKSGLIFTKAFTSSNLCSPSRLGIATGRHQANIGVYRNIDGEATGIIPGTHLARIVKEQGYMTAHIGKWHIGRRNIKVVNEILARHGIKEKISNKELLNQYPEIYKEVQDCGYLGSVVDEQNPLNNGFDYYYGYNYWASQFYNSTLVWENFKHAGKQKGYNTDVFTDKAMDFMEEQINTGNPFYVQLFYHAVHDSLEPKAPDMYFNRFDSDSYDLNNFFAHVYGVDFNVNRIIEFLKLKGVYENTMIVFTSDNGAMCEGPYNGIKTGSPLPGNTPFSGHKGNYYQGGIRIPLFIHWPGGIKNPDISDKLVSTMDILPTAIDVAGGKLPDGIDGRSLTPLFESNPVKEIHDHLIWAGIHSFQWGYLITKTTKTQINEAVHAPPAWAVVQGEFLLRFTGTLEPGIYLDYLKGRGPVIELFNIKDDPAELNNIAGELPQRVKEMAKIYFSESKDFRPPSKWEKKKWEELVNSKDLIKDLP